jgi:acyl transferase domain-containing protein
MNSGKTVYSTRNDMQKKIVLKSFSSTSKNDKTENPGDIAIIGASGRFPGAENLDEFWSNMANGVNSVTEIPKERWDIDLYYETDREVPGKTYSRYGGYLKDIDKFDPLFFNISPMEAEIIDPQQRLFLEEAWKALEDAGYSDESLSNIRCGVFVGATGSDYRKKLENSCSHATAEAFIGSSSAILAARISYFLNLTGPSVAIDTACSSSLVAIHQACQSINSAESDMAIAGGITLMTTPDIQIQTSKMGILSPEGKCKTFDSDADGTVMSEGVGVVVLKSLQRALQDGDHIYGVIKGSGINQDGKTNGITAPNAQSQTQLELEVYKRAGINPENISMVEAHGTATKLGDPIEIKALTDAFREYTQKKQFCAIGTVKTNIGHTTMSAGVAGLIKYFYLLNTKRYLL